MDEFRGIDDGKTVVLIVIQDLALWVEEELGIGRINFDVKI